MDKANILELLHKKFNLHNEIKATKARILRKQIIYTRISILHNLHGIKAIKARIPIKQSFYTRIYHLSIYQNTNFYLRSIMHLKIFRKNTIPKPVVQLLQGSLRFFNASPTTSMAGMISLPRCMGIYTKLKLIHWTLDVHHSCASLISCTFKNNSLNFVQKRRKNIS